VDKKVLKETDKAVLIKNEANEEVWLPKSQVKVEDGKVVEIPDWLKKQENII